MKMGSTMDTPESDFYDQALDHVASRAEAYSILIRTIDELKSDKLRREGTLMLSVIRRTIKTLSQAELTVMHK